jgi:alpha-1,2-mannosyltransferase
VKTARLRLTVRELRGQLVVLGVVLWAAAIFNAATPTWRLRSGQIKGTDFIQFYTLARLSADGAADRFADAGLRNRIQAAAVPGATDVSYPPAYGPQVGLALTPLGWLSYGWALAGWITLTFVVYLAIVRALIAQTRVIAGVDGVALLAAVSFPPFWYLVQYGQLSAVALLCVWLAWLAQRRESEWWSGLAIGMLAYKPPLAVPAIAILALAGEWRMVLAASACALAQVLIAGIWVGVEGLRAYGDLLAALPSQAAVLGSQAAEMHSWRGFWALLIPHEETATVAYGLSAAATIVAAAVLWRRLGDTSLRMAALILGTVLASPHLYVYDLVVLAPVWLWLTDWYLSRPDLSPTVGRMLYVGYLAPLFVQLTAIVHLQISVLCFAVLLGLLWTQLRASFEPAPT